MREPRIEAGVLGAVGTVGQQIVSRLARHPWFRLAWVGGSARSAGRRYGEALRGTTGASPTKCSASGWRRRRRAACRACSCELAEVGGREGGGLRRCPVLDWKFVATGHNSVRAARPARPSSTRS